MLLFNKVLAEPLSVGLAATSSVAAGSTWWVKDYTLPFVGVPVTVVTMAAAGALLSFAYGSPEGNRRRLFGLAVANTFIGAAVVTVIPAAFNLTWVNPLILPPLAFLAALFARWLVPLFVEVLPNWVRKWLNVSPNAGVK